MLLHGLLLSKFGLSVRKAAFAFIRAGVLEEVLAKFCLVVSLILGINVGSPLILTVHTTHLLLHSLVIVIGTGLEGTWGVHASALVSTSTTSRIASLLVLPLKLVTDRLLLVNRLRSLVLNWRSCILHIWSSTRSSGLGIVSESLLLAKASTAALIGARHIRVKSSTSTSSASTTIAKVLSIRIASLFEFSLSMCKDTGVADDTVAAVGVVSAHLSLVLGLVDVLATKVARLLVLHRLKLLRLGIVINNG